MVTRTCKNPACRVEFAPEAPMQTYHDPECQRAAAKVRERARKREQARARAMEHGPGARDEIASTYMDRASNIERAVCDVEYETLLATEPARLYLLESTLEGVASAEREADEIALRGQLIALASQATEWAARLDRPVRRRVGRGGYSRRAAT